MKVPGNIEEMARVLDACPFIGAPIGFDKHDGSIKIAEYLYHEGYSKQSEVEKLKADLEVWKQNRFNIFQMLELYKMTKKEVAREIFAEIDRAVEDAEFEWGTIFGVKLCIAELKKKYTEVATDERAD